MTLREIINKTAPEISYPKVLGDIQVETDLSEDELRSYLESTKFGSDADICVEVISEAIKDNLGMDDFILSFPKGENGKRFLSVEIS